jgi:hypothetical protein
LKNTFKVPFRCNPKSRRPTKEKKMSVNNVLFKKIKLKELRKIPLKFYPDVIQKVTNLQKEEK